MTTVFRSTQGKNQLLVAATDLNVSLTAELKSQDTGEGGITLGAKNLHEAALAGELARTIHAFGRNPRVEGQIQVFGVYLAPE
jgi:hypothetical protein